MFQYLNGKNFQTYQLFIRISKEVQITVGKLGRFVFPPGIYVYTGSAKTNIEARIKRHQSTTKKIRWHIDYLLLNAYSEIVKVAKFTEPECFVNKQTAGKIIIPKFGASDCTNNCGSHLKYLGEF